MFDTQVAGTEITATLQSESSKCETGEGVVLPSSSWVITARNPE